VIGSTTRAEWSVGPGVRCTFCHGEFARRDGPLSCGGCGGLLHEGCWYEAGRCPSLGCAGPDARPARRRRPPLRSPRPQARYVWAIGAGLHLVTLGAWLAIGLGALLLGGVWIVLAGVLLGCWLLLAAVQRDWRLDAPWLLVLSGLAAGVALFPILLCVVQLLERVF
jgi:hypothetical protein